MPPHASIMGSSAVTIPLAGICQVTLLLFFLCIYGSRFDTTKICLPFRYALKNSLSRSAVHGVSSFSKRRRASSLAAKRARLRLCVIFEISVESGLKKPLPFSDSPAVMSPLLAAFTDSANFERGLMNTEYAMRKMAIRNKSAMRRRRIRLWRQIFQIVSSIYCAFWTTIRAPKTRSSSCIGSTKTYSF